jgi:HD superfamily phosphohydrolase
MKHHSSQSWLSVPDRIRPFLKGVDDFLARTLIPIPQRPPSDKIIADPLTGYVSIRSWEMALLDTRLLQRLRRIRQLGLAYLVFPTLGYSRFEHTLGVLGRLERALTYIRTNARKSLGDDRLASLIAEHELSMRLAALMHDAGHCAYSHLTERVIDDLPVVDNYPSILDIRQCFSDAVESSTLLPVSEVFSVAMLASPVLHDFLSTQHIPGRTDEVLWRWLENAARFMAGMPAHGNSHTTFIGQLINGGLDIDKMDYMTRDAYFAGVALEIDQQRILSKLSVFDVGAEDVPSGLTQRLSRTTDTRNQRNYILGLARGGQFAYEEFCIARVALYDKIYLHQKVRAAEAQLRRLLSGLPDADPAFRCAHAWLDLRESYQEYAEDDEDRLPLFPPPAVARLGLRAIEDRRLYHRAFAFGPSNCLTDSVGMPALGSDGLELGSLRAIERIRKERREFCEAIARCAREIDKRLELGSDEDAFDQIVVDVPRYTSVQADVDTIYFERTGRQGTRWALPIDQIVRYYQHNRALAYVFTTVDLCPLISLATEYTLWKWSRVLFEQDGHVPRYRIDECRQMKQRLLRYGYYDDVRELRPIDHAIQSREARNLVTRVVEILRRFRNPLSHEPVSVASVDVFVGQFPADLQLEALRLLQHLQLIEERDLLVPLTEAMDAAMKEGRKRIALVPIGGIADSSAHLAFTLRGQGEFEARSGVVEIVEIAEALGESYDHIILFDDNINTGRQCVHVVASWLDVDPGEEWLLKEKHVRKLERITGERLRSARCSLAVSVARRSRVTELADKLCSLGLATRPIVYAGRWLDEDKRVLSGGSGAFQSPQRLQLRDYLRDIGQRLLLKEGKSGDRAAHCALGYDAAEAMIVFPYNVPTMTMTALWCRGHDVELPWIPLIERRRRKDSQGQVIDEE